MSTARIAARGSKWIALAAGCLAALPAAAQAVSTQQPQRTVYFALVGGISGGGEELARVRFAGAPAESIDAGGLLHLAAGVVLHAPRSPFALQATIGWQSDSVRAENGEVSFTRHPIELIGFWHPAPHWRLGSGLRIVNDARFVADIHGLRDTVTYADSLGLVIETGLRVFPGGWINLRYVSESYEPQRLNGVPFAAGDSVSGRAFGVNLLWSF